MKISNKEKRATRRAERRSSKELLRRIIKAMECSLTGNPLNTSYENEF